eukprot:TRINITY_DN4144_c0_g1_i3.p1 TRINITY_DN4144_c0_g1~~TRINITY_DN4144_c0_g1_i3.p1  ORF type:complete len:148 (+),score=37.80 TRINITY_DN4144_c0_g1_i3:715-1158(+)
MLKTVKRPHDDLIPSSPTPISCSPRKIEFLDSPNKKIRGRLYDGTQTKIAPGSRPESPFLFTPDHESVVQDSLVKKKIISAAKEPLYTMEDVRAIVQKAIQETEERLKVEYDRILQEKLQEQYNTFLKFNEDHVNRQLKESHFTYMS